MGEKPAIESASKPVTLNAPTIVAADSGVRVVGAAEYKQAAQCLAEAFWDDHTTHYFLDCPDRNHWTDDQKWDLHVSMMEYIVYAHCLKGLVLTTGPNYGCVALWMPPGQNMDDWLTIVRSGMWRLNYQLSAEGKARFFNEFLPLLHDTKHSVLRDRDDDSWYLVYIGTKAAARGKGLARKLVEHVSSMADAEKRACYLESSNDINPIIYGKLGFSIARQIYLQRDDHPIRLDIMVREPRVQEKAEKAAIPSKEASSEKKEKVEVHLTSDSETLGTLHASYRA